MRHLTTYVSFSWKRWSGNIPYVLLVKVDPIHAVPRMNVELGDQLTIISNARLWIRKTSESALS